MNINQGRIVMKNIDFDELNQYAKQFAKLDDDKIAMLHSISTDLIPHLQQVTDDFYAHLSRIEKVQPFLEGRIDALKSTHHVWMKDILTGSFDAEYTQQMYKVGDVHVKVKLPVEFMAGGMTIIKDGLSNVVLNTYQGNASKQQEALAAINAALGFSLLVMQESYQSSALAEELEKFLLITGMSRTLFDNLARAYSN
jgi:hypothetical protein